MIRENEKNNKKIHNSINRDYHQRNHLMKYKKLNDDDLILISDLDEIPKSAKF